MEIKFEKPLNNIADKLETWLEVFVTMLPNMVVAIIVLSIFFTIATVIRRITSKVVKKATDNLALQSLFSKIVYAVIVGIGIFVVLGILKLDKTVTSLLAGVGVIGLALGFAFQDIASNFVSGIILAFRTPFQVGEIIEVKGYMGKVSRANLRVTVIENFDGQEIYIPNKEVLQTAIKNYSATGLRRINLTIGVSYADDLKIAQEKAVEAIKDLNGVMVDKGIDLFYTDFGDSSVNFSIKFWIKYPDEPGFLTVRSEAIKAIKRSFDENDITIPFPIRTLDFGIEGGKELSAMSLKVSNENGSQN